MQFIIIAFALLLTWQNDTRNNKSWYGNHANDTMTLIITIDEPPIEKEKSYKANGRVEVLFTNDTITIVDGKILLYFSKGRDEAKLKYGDQVLVHSHLQAIQNSGNPGAFDYRQYAAFHHTFHSIYLKPGDWILQDSRRINPFSHLIFSIRRYVITVLQTFIISSKNELGIAEALLIGYKEDLDKELIQAYSNAGVVHIIAISGLHLGLIYVMLTWLINRIPGIKKSKIFKVILILAGLWMFAILAGAAGSVLRSAVMFTFIVIGKNFFKQASMYNSLAASAFLLLCYDPYLLWDVGFQLSYFAIIGIVALQGPIKKLIYFKLKWISKLWSMIAVTLAAQLATFPICIYYFHQFPNLFFITNLVAVPLSTVILFDEILLIAISWIPVIAGYLGTITGWLLWLMNYFITTINSLPYSLWSNITANLLTTFVLYLLIISIGAWMLYKHKIYFRMTIFILFLFCCIQVLIKLQTASQKKMVIYNIPKYQAIDFIYQDKYHFAGDTVLQKKGQLQNFHLLPSRLYFHLKEKETMLKGLFRKDMCWQFFNKKILIIDSGISFVPLAKKIEVDVLIISKDPTLNIIDVFAAVHPGIIVFDSSNSMWKIAKWKTACDQLALSCFSVPEQGAFVFNIDK